MLTPQEPILVLTAERHDGHYDIQLNAKVIPLSHGLLMTLLDLVAARGTTKAGFVQVSRVVIHRLRQAIDRATEPAMGLRLVETGCGEEYRLTVPAGQLARRVLLAPDFEELEQIGALSRELGRRLRQICGRLKTNRNPRETEMKPN